MFAERTYKKELLDLPGIPFHDIRQNMMELDFINTWLGGHGISIQGLSRLTSEINQKKLRVCEIGCGGGDNLRAIRDWGRKNDLDLELVGVDLNEECIKYARSRDANQGIEFIHSDYRLYNGDPKPDIIFSSLFCHHFTENELVTMLQWMGQQAKHGFFINDLHRHRMAYYSIGLLTKLFSKSYLVKHDAPLSVLRGFKRKEWEELFQQAGLNPLSIRWKWAFRWLIIFKK